MNIVFGTNIWNHYQGYFATELKRLLEGAEQFKMVLFEEVHDERRKMGWAESVELPWVLGPPRSVEEEKRLLQTCLDADVMVVGDCPPKVREARIATGKLTLIASERILKQPFYYLRMLNPRYARGIRRYRTLVNHPHVHALAIGHYAPCDLRTIGAFADRIWKWGYFNDTPAILAEPHPVRPIKLLWAGRMLKWKRVDLLLQALAKLQDTESIGECTIIGDGPERQRLLNLASRMRLAPDRVKFLSSLPFNEIRRLMREADVYVLASNRHEGWGIVANEAMFEGCILVANEAAGAARDLIQDGENGLLFRDGDVEQLAAQLKRLASDYPLRIQMRQKAWSKMHKIWHPRVAAERLVTLCNGLMGKTAIPDYKDGPCSRIIS
jgi:glycosyltransferase involved in cell wall biosynthesis